MKRVLIASCICLMMGGCAGLHHGTSSQRRPMVASLTPIAVPAQNTLVQKEATAGVLLEQGLGLFLGANYQPSIVAFEQAIQTGRLNDAGRALAYWHIFSGQQALESKDARDASMDSLASFIAVAERILEQRDELRYATNAYGDFVDRFNMLHRLHRGRALISAKWAHRNKSFGRSMEHPVLVRTPNEIPHFMEAMVRCKEHTETRIGQRRIQNSLGEDLQIVTFACGQNAQSSYYFDVAQ